MKKIFPFILLICFGIAIVAASCSHSGLSSFGSTNSKGAQPRPANAPKPKNWPWRGVCIESLKTDYKDIAYLSSVNVNCIRIQIKAPKRAKREKSDPTKAFYDELEWADKILDECKKYNMTSVIAFNLLVLDPTSTVTDKSYDFWDKHEYTDSVYSMVDIIAKKFAARGDELCTYEVIGEPAVQDSGAEFGKSSTPPNIEKFYSTVLAHIRKYDQKRYFLLSPGPWGKPMNYANFDGFDINDSKLIYGAHMYVPFPFTLQGIRKHDKGVVYPGFIDGKEWNKEALAKCFQSLERFANQHNALVYIGEFQAARWSSGRDQWVKDVADIIESKGWSWTYFCFQSDQIFWDPYYDVANPDDPAEKWKVEFVGKETNNWKFMTQTYFSRNKK